MKINDYWNGWRIAEHLGEGTFGTVYRIEKTEYGHVYNSALKVIQIPRSQAEVKTVQNEGMDDKSMTLYFNSMVENISSELALMSKLRGHSNIVSYEDHEVVKHEDSFGWDIFIKMELLTPLYDHINKSTVTLRDVVQIGIDICKALELCSKYNIIHRDIKPENIFYSEHGDYKLGDFGIARELEKTMSGLSRTGTPSYMAPEVYKGLPYNSTVDTYSLGVVLYRILNSNRNPFLPNYPTEITYEDRQTANIKRISGDEFPSPVNADDKLSKIILRACDYDPKKRFASAEEMRKALEEYDCSEHGNVVLLPLKESKPVSERTFDDISADNNDETAILSELNQHNGQQSKLNESQNDDQLPIEIISDKPVLFKRYRKTAVAGIIGVLILVAFGGFRFFHHTVPKVVGLHSDAAELSIKHAGLKYNEEDRVFADSVARGIVLSQSKKANQQVRRGTVIDVIVSKGLPIKLPDITGKDKVKATDILEEKQLVLKVEKSEYSDTVKKGRIISQNPAAGTECEQTQIITVVLSKGIKLVEVPNVVGLTQEDAEKSLGKAGLKIETEYINSASSPGIVIAQAEDAGSKVEKNSTVLISISTTQSTYKSTPSKRKSKSSSSGGASTTEDAETSDEAVSGSGESVYYDDSDKSVEQPDNRYVNSGNQSDSSASNSRSRDAGGSENSDE